MRWIINPQLNHLWINHFYQFSPLLKRIVSWKQKNKKKCISFIDAVSYIQGTEKQTVLLLDFFFTLSTTTPNYSMCFFSSAILFISGMFLGGCENISVGSVPSFVCKRVIQREGSTKIYLSSRIMAGVSFHPEYGIFLTESLILL